MSCAAPTQVLAVLARAREGVAHGQPSLELALARSAWGRPAELLAQAKAVLAAPATAQAAPPWVRALAEALTWVARARAEWGTQLDAMPALGVGEAPCAAELRQHLVHARHCAAMQLAWEDAGGLTRPQALCVVQLALTLARWGVQSGSTTPVASTPPPPPTPARRPVRLPYAEEYTPEPEDSP